MRSLDAVDWRAISLCFLLLIVATIAIMKDTSRYAQQEHSFQEYKTTTDAEITKLRSDLKFYQDIVLKQQAEVQQKLEAKRKHAEFLKSEVGCLAENIYRESAYEPEAGQLAVATVTMNRVASPGYPKSVCSVVYQRGVDHRSGKIVCQFSWSCKARHRIITSVYKRILIMARAVYFQHERSQEAPDAILYHATYIPTPKWGTDDNRIITIGQHVFYR